MELDHIHIRCQDLEAAVKWYQEVMGAEIQRRGEVPGMPIVRMLLGGAVLALSPQRAEMQVEPLSGSPRWGVWQVSFKVADIQASYKELSARGAKFKGEPTAQTPTILAAFIDAPDGVEIELVQFL